MIRKYDWLEIRKFCSKGNVNRKDVYARFGCTSSMLCWAIKKGKIDKGWLNSSVPHRNKYDWEFIQGRINEGIPQRQIAKEIGCSSALLYRAKKEGKIKTIGLSDAMKLAHRRCPRKHSEKTKRLISKKRKRYLSLHPDKVPYLLNHCSKGSSYPERYFEALFKKEGIELTKYYRIGNYQLDFADVINKIDIEIDGSQHRYDFRIVESDRKRDQFLSLRGWRIIRIYWPDYQKKTYEEKAKVVNKIKIAVGPVAQPGRAVGF